MRNRFLRHAVRLRPLLPLAALIWQLGCAPAAVSPSAAANQSPTATPPLPEPFQSPSLNPLDTPHSYIQDTCQYLRNKWNPVNAAPGTVVMIIFIGSIYNGPVEQPGGMNINDLERMMQQLHDQGFEAINTERFLAFIERNKIIPPRSVLIIQDGSFGADNFSMHFHESWENWHWPIVNGWTSSPDTSAATWQENAQLEKDGWVDHQAEGVTSGTVLTDDTSKAVISRELQGSIDAFAAHFAKTPLAFIWPGGSFGARPVLAARELGYQLGFTSNQRGPVMFNWVPLADAADAQRPAMTSEGDIGDPLMTLPRYAADQVVDAIDQVRLLGREAAAYALAHKSEEIKYYNIVCAPTRGPLPSP